MLSVMTVWNSTLLRDGYPVAEAHRLRNTPMRVTLFGRAVMLDAVWMPNDKPGKRVETGERVTQMWV